MRVFIKNNPFHIFSIVVGVIMLLCPLSYIRYKGNLFSFKVTGVVSNSGMEFPLEMNTLPLMLLVFSILALSVFPIVRDMDNWKKIKINTYCIYLCSGYVVLAYFMYVIRFSSIDAEVRDVFFAVLLPFINICALYSSNKKIRREELKV